MSVNDNVARKGTVLFIHGLWLTSRSWKGWMDRYQKAGYAVLAPTWPGLEGEVEAIRRDPSPLRGLKGRRLWIIMSASSAVSTHRLS